ncbi:helix-turn-helix domain-containing protein [Sphingomonas sp.]|uniref:helix-turn-helix domain-containing protein n=1 Tax=Sphingomonas sp. TaxID=28214 RepID=UPI003B00D6EA
MAVRPQDRRIGAAISAMHTEPARRWTVQGLAEHAGMSRTSFAVRFKRRVGSSPMEYLTRLRMLLASDRPATSDQAISVVAEAFEYEFESAFSSAFKRHLGCSPRRFATGATRKTDFKQRAAAPPT